MLGDTSPPWAGHRRGATLPVGEAARQGVGMTGSMREFTLRGFVLGAALTLIFSASNAYLGLKVGMTFATSIPAAVMSMAILRAFGGTGILENNIVQTIASAGAAVVSVIFTLPALVMIGFWSGFPFWLVFGITAATGILGVVFTVPLRRAMVVESDLKYPEGVAAAEVLRAGQAEAEEPASGRRGGGAVAGLRDISFGAGLAAIVALVTDGFRLAADAGNLWWRIGEARFGIGVEYSLALVGAGYLIGLRAAFGLLVGVVLAWFVAVPILSAVMTWPADMSAEAVASKVWSDDVRFIGVGAIGFGAIWTLLALLRPLWDGMKASVRAYAKIRSGVGGAVPREERDLPPPVMAGLILAMLLPLVILMIDFIADGPAAISGGTYWALVVFASLYVLLSGFLMASAAGYMAGLLGSSSSPISGIAVLALLGGAVVLTLWFAPGDGSQDDTLRIFLVAASVFMATGVLGVASIANDNLQDLKTGQLVGATPWKQQASLIFGVAVGALVVPPIMELLYNAYGMGGSLPRAGMDPGNVLQAPQAMMIQTLGRGIVSATLNWTFIGIGVAGGILLVIWNSIAARLGWEVHISPLAVGIAMYLPSMISVTILAGAVLNHLLERGRRHASATDSEEAAGGTGTLVSAGMIVGASMFGVLIAILIVTSGNGDPLQLANLDQAPAGPWIGLAVFLVAVGLAAAYIRRRMH